jgi:hypothetical protein
MDLSTRLTTFDSDLDWSAVWAESGAMSLSGRAGDEALTVPVQMVRVLTAAAGVVEELSALGGRRVVIDGPALLGERAAILMLGRHGEISCGGSTRLLRSADSWIALSLARESDRASLAAWLQLAESFTDSEERTWEIVTAAVATMPSQELVDRAALLGLPCSRLSESSCRDPLIITRRRVGNSAPLPLADVTVVDLSSLWAGPLCANLLGLAGARVVKVESATRPDGGRLGNAAFFDLLHGGHETVALDFSTDSGRGVLHQLIGRADVVIEASRPRAFQQLGIDRRIDVGPKVWLSITGHGRGEDAAHRVAFGDDAAVAGGLVTQDSDGLCFCCDAVADPATGLIAAAAVLDRLAVDGHWSVDLALSRTAAWLADDETTSDTTCNVPPPRHRPLTTRARDLGVDTDVVLSRFGL